MVKEKKNDWEEMGTTPAWDYQSEGKGAELVGIFKGCESDVGPNHSNLYTFDSEEEGLIVIWGNTMLDNRFKNLEEGELVKIVYEGKMKSEKRKGATYHSFKVFHKKMPKLDETALDEVEPDLDK